MTVKFFKWHNTEKLGIWKEAVEIIQVQIGEEIGGFKRSGQLWGSVISWHVSEALLVSDLVTIGLQAKSK